MTLPPPGQGPGGVSHNTFAEPAVVQGHGGVQNIYNQSPPRGTWPVALGAASVVLAAAAGAFLALWFDDGPGGGETDDRRGAAVASGPAAGRGSPPPGGTGSAAGRAAPTSGAVGPTAADGAAPPDTADGAAPSDAGGAGERVRWSGTLRISGVSGPQLDQEPPVKSPYTRDVWLAEVDPAVLQGSGIGGVHIENLALWERPDAPTRAQCEELVATQGVAEVVVRQGSVVCVRTLEGRTAVLTVRSVSTDAQSGILAEARVWSATDMSFWLMSGGGTR
ncbi:hypothetical protein [Streptomyces thermolilacinus]|uniref:hypothetical protein n=1 Tax=Streptomyces thermolilacinus TaxID=285540 RepID=UPI001112DECA|nr:hypothetical protein [Streptomyces thermolilacinus]